MSINNLVCFSDIHAGSRLGLYPIGVDITLDEGGSYKPSVLQEKLWAYWLEFWDVWVPWATNGEEYAIVNVGDVVDGVHHGSVSQISHNLGDQAKIAVAILEPIVAKTRHYFHIRGTGAHVGPSGTEEERVAKELGAVPNSEGQYARYELYLQIGTALVHAAHHIGSTGSSAYEGTAVHKELVESYGESARWGERPPDYIIRGHRHRHFESKITTVNGSASSIVCPGWQAKTDFGYKIGMRMSPPQFGGVVIRQGQDKHYATEKVWSIVRPKVEQV